MKASNKCKAYTSLEQSKKLAEILPIESANMAYFCNGKNELLYPTPFIVNDRDGYYSRIYCWSLNALLDVINTNYYTTLYHDGVAWNIDIIHHDNVKEKYSMYADTPVDACVEMILKLHEQKLL